MDDFIYHGPGHPMGAHFHSGPKGERGLPGVSPKVDMAYNEEEGTVVFTVTDGFSQRNITVSMAELVSDWMERDSYEVLKQWMTDHADAEWRTDDDGILHLSNVPPDADDRIGLFVAEWLDEHPEASTSVQDGAITEPKFSDALKLKTINAYVTPEMFGAKGDGITDDTTALLLWAASKDAKVCRGGKTYVYNDTLVFSNRFDYVNGQGATLKYTGTNEAIKIDQSNSPSHKGDVSFFGNLTVVAKNATHVFNINRAIKSVLNNIRVYDFTNTAFYSTGGIYETKFDNIYLFGRKGYNTIGFDMVYGDSEYGSLYGCNVKTFLTGKFGSNLFERIHAWNANGVNLEDETSLSDDDYLTWFEDTVLIDITQRTGGGSWLTRFNYVNCDTYSTCIAWDSYWRHGVIGTLQMHASNSLIKTLDSGDSRNNAHYFTIENLDVESQTIVSTITSSQARRQPTIHFINGVKYVLAASISYTNYNGIDVDIFIPLKEFKFVPVKKPQADTLTLTGVYIAYYMSLENEVNEHTSTVIRPWNGAEGNAILYKSNFATNTVLAMACCNDDIDSSSRVRLTKESVFTPYAS